jgi:hypothetical protein
VVAGVRPVNTTTLEYVREVAYVVEMDEQALEVKELLEVPYWTQLWSSFSYVFHPIDTALGPYTARRCWKGVVKSLGIGG